MYGDIYVTQYGVSSLSHDESQRIYEFCNSLMAESFESFHCHVSLHDVVYLFRKKDTNELVGVSYWRNRTTQNPHIKVILQGKLRIHKDYRRLGLHNRAGLYYYIRCQIRAPFTRFYFMSIASIFNFVSMRKTVGEYYILNGDHPPSTPCSVFLLYPILQAMMKEDSFEFDEETKAIFVHVTIREEVMNEFPASYYLLPEAQEYIRVNPKFKEAHDIAYAYPFTFWNVMYILWRVVDQAWWRQFRTWLNKTLRLSSTRPIAHQDKRQVQGST